MNDLKQTHQQISDGGLGELINRIQNENKEVMRKPKHQYKMVQMDAELHKYLKDYCSYHGFSISGFVAALVRQSLANNKRK
jgi:hypothetical protein